MRHQPKKPGQGAEGSPVQPTGDRAGEPSRPSFERHGAMLDGLLEGYEVIDSDWRYLYVNEAFARQARLTVRELLHHTMMEVFPGIESTELFSALRGCRQDHRPRQMDLRWEYPDGSVGWYELRIEAIPEGLFVLSIDITERKRATDALRESERRLAESQRVAGVGSWAAELPDSQMRWSDETYRIYGVSRDTFVPTAESLFGLIHSADRAGLQESIRACLADERPHEMEFRSIRPDGSIRWLSGRGQLVYDDARKPIRIIGTVQDITERKELEAQFLQSQKMESVGRLAGGVAHDFNNLLSVILGWTGMALADLPPEHPIRESLEEVVRAGEGAASLTKQLLAFSRQQVVEPTVFNPNALVAEMKKSLRRLIGEDIELITRPAPDLGTVKMDRGQLEQVFMNLVVNARDAMPKGGKLVLETANVALDAEYPRRHADVAPGDYVMLAVTDSGTGMSEDVKTHIFEAFFTTKAAGKGTGLGLATSHGIVKQAGGHIDVYSEMGVGTTMKIYLPRTREAGAPVARRSGATSAHGVETILLVEDDEAVRRVTARMLERQGYHVLGTGSGEEALRVIQEDREPLHLLLTDVVLAGGMSGRVLAERVRALRPKLKVLYASGYTSDVTILQGLPAEGIRLVRKPFTAGTLGREVRDALDHEQESPQHDT